MHMKAEGKSSKIGILGGTFNPIHNGHMELARQAINEFHLDKLLIMPNNIPAYKNNENIISGLHRFNMAVLAAKNEARMEASDIELKREGVTYTSDTLKLLTEEYPDASWYFIIGGDSLMSFDTRHKPDMILKLSKLLVASRANIDNSRLFDKINFLKSKHNYAQILTMDITPVDISSTNIRENIRNGKSIKGMVHDDVLKYIMDNRLYSEQEI